jgi:hypothetical protein
MPRLTTKDFYGSVINYNGRWDLGAYSDTSNYIWQDTTKLLFGQKRYAYTTTDVYIYDSLIYKLQIDSIMRNARLLYVFGGPDTAISRRSLKLEDTLLITTGTITHTAYKGWQSIDRNGFLTVPINPGYVENAPITAGSSSWGILITTNSSVGSYDISAGNGTKSRVFIRTRDTATALNNYVRATLNNWSFGPAVNLTDSTSKGFTLINRIGNDDTIEVYKNGIKIYQLKDVVVDLTDSGDIDIGGYATTGAPGPSGRMYNALWYGAGLTYSQQYKLNEHLKWYYWRVGQPITAAPLPDASPVSYASNLNYILFTYTPVLKENDTLKMYYFTIDSTVAENTVYYRRISTNYGTSWVNNTTVTLTGVARDAIFRQPDNQYRMFYHRNVSPGFRIKPTNVSTNGGLTFDSSSYTLYKGTNTDANKIVGEDIGVFYNSDSSKYYIYFRPYPSNQTTDGNSFRKIGLAKTSDFSTYTYNGIILPVDSTQFFNTNSRDYRKTFYNMSVFKTASNEWWGIVNMLKLEDYQWPGSIGTLEPELVFSRNGETWHRTNDSLAFIPRPTNINQLFVLPTVVNDQVWFYGSTHQPKHGQDDLINQNFVMVRYRITIADLRKYIPRGI